MESLGRRPPRLPGSTRNKTRIEKVLAEHKGGQGSEKEGRRRSKRRDKPSSDLVKRIVDENLSSSDGPKFFAGTVLEGKFKPMNTRKKSKEQIQRRRPKSEGYPKTKKLPHKIRSSSSRRSNESSSSNHRETSKRKNGKKIPTLKSGKDFGSPRVEGGGTMRRRECESSRQGQLKDKLPEISQIEMEQERRRKELESYLAELKIRQEEAGDPGDRQLALVAINKDGDEESISEPSRALIDKKKGNRQVVLATKGKAPEKRLNVRKFLKGVERKFLANYPAYCGTLCLKGGEELGKLTKIDGFSAKIDSLLQNIGSLDALGGSNMGFQPVAAEQEALDDLDAKINRINKMRDNSRTADLVDRARKLVHDLKIQMRRSASANGFGTDRSTWNKFDDSWSEAEGDIKVDSNQVKLLVKQAQSELGNKVFLTQSNRTGDNSVTSAASSTPSNQSKDNQAWKNLTLDPEIEKEYSGYPNLLDSLRKAKLIPKYVPQIDLRKKSPYSLRFLRPALETLRQSERLKKELAKSQLPESHKQPLAASQPLPPVKDVKISRKTSSSDTYEQKSARDLVSKTQRLLDNVGKTLGGLRERTGR